jgi:hypothetical protein
MADEYRLNFRRAEGYRLIPATAVVAGGIRGQHLVLEFIVDTVPPPDHAIIRRMPDGSARAISEQPAEHDQLRELQIGVVLTEPAARELLGRLQAFFGSERAKDKQDA